MPRKTIPVERVKELVNGMLERSADDVSPDSRLMVASLLETILMETGNYHGFGYLPGVIDFDKNPPEVIGDESRRRYH